MRSVWPGGCLARSRSQLKALPRALHRLLQLLQMQPPGMPRFLFRWHKPCQKMAVQHTARALEEKTQLQGSSCRPLGCQPVLRRR